MSNRGYRRRPRKRITGRFYAFLTVLVVAVVFVGVLIGNQGKGSTGQPSNVISPMVQNTPVIINQGAPTLAPAPQATDPIAQPDITPAPADPESLAGTSGIAAITDIYGDGEEYALIAEEDKVKVNSLSVKEGLPTEWRNILLLGSDSRDVKKVTRTDTIMIASINANTGRVKLVSVMRDLVVSATNKKGEVKQVKINSLVNMGGVELVMKTINELFGMNITEYVLVNFSSFQKVVDILGGIDMDITEDEMKQINISLGEMAKAAGYDQAWYMANKDNLTLRVYGPQTHLTGMQALGFARIRHVGAGDYRRTERQREVLDAILRKVKDDANVIQMMQLATSMWGEINTNVDFGSAVGLATTVIKNGAVKIDQGWRIPGTSTSFKSEKRSPLGAALYDCDFKANAELLYKFIYES